MNNNKAMKIEFNEPAKCWEEALPIGNGKMGAMVYGTIATERLQLNEDSVWYGGKQDRINPSALDKLPEIRSLIMAGKINEAQELCAFALSGIPDQQRHYEPLGNLYLEFMGKDYELGNNVTDYHRELDISRAVATTEYVKDGVRFKREIIASYPRNAIIIHLTADKSGMISLNPQLGRGAEPWDMSPYQTQGLRRPNYTGFCDRISALDNNIQLMEATAGGEGGVKMAAAMKICALGGKITRLGSSFLIENADEVLIIVTADTTFREQNPAESSAKRAEDIANNISDENINISEGWNLLLAEHEKDYTNLFNRVKLEIEGQDEITRFFQFGRYLLIASSRPGSLPANLQGIWNKDFNPAWGSKYTININTEMNYWPAMVCNLTECQKPLIDMIERMRTPGRETAKRMYGCGGFMAHHNTDIWCDTAPQDVCLSATYWVMGAAWLCLHIWEQYQFTSDKEFLKEHFDTMCEAAQFIMDYLIPDGNYLVTCPTLSPENEYILQNGESGFVCKGATMDNEIIRELFSACIEAFEILEDTPGNASGNTSENTIAAKDFIDKLQSTLGKIAPLKIGRHGQIMEWNEDYEEAEPGHRHISQLFGLYPGSTINDSNPDFMEAAYKTIERRLSFGGGHSGWSRAWIINMLARLKKGDEALENIKILISKQTLPNLFDDHPPFQIDGNFGCSAGMAEMLVQSVNGEIKLLPALPKEWKKGKVEGLLLRGGKILKTLEWEDGKVINCVIEPL